ncbi:MAG: helix-turn-helix domain-containing protein [Sphingomonadaceae bacterium]
MSNYNQLSIEECCSIARLREAEQSIRQIAAALDRSPLRPSDVIPANAGIHLPVFQPCKIR